MAARAAGGDEAARDARDPTDPTPAERMVVSTTAASSYEDAVARDAAARESGILEMIKVQPASASPCAVSFPGVVVTEEARHVGRISAASFQIPPPAIHLTPKDVIFQMYPLVKTFFESKLLRRHLVLAGGAVAQIALAIAHAETPAAALKVMRSWRPKPKVADLDDQYDAAAYQLKIAPNTIGVGDLDFFIVGVRSIPQADQVKAEIEQILKREQTRRRLVRESRRKSWNKIASALGIGELTADGASQFAHVEKRASSGTSFTWIMSQGVPDVQLITSLNVSPAHVIYSFDLTASSFAFDGDDILATPLSYWTLMTSIIPINPSRVGGVYSARLISYHLKKGWSVGLPETDGVDLSVPRRFAGDIHYTPDPPKLELDEVARVAEKTTEYGEVLGREMQVARGESWFTRQQPRALTIRDCRRFLYDPCLVPLMVFDGPTPDAETGAELRHNRCFKTMLAWLSDPAVPDPPEYLQRMLLPEDVVKLLDTNAWKFARQAPALLCGSEWRRVIAEIVRRSRNETVRDGAAAAIAPDLLTPAWVYAGRDLRGFTRKAMTLKEWYGTPVPTGAAESKEPESKDADSAAEPTAEPESKDDEPAAAESRADEPAAAESRADEPGPRAGIDGIFSANVREHIFNALGIEPAARAAVAAPEKYRRLTIAGLVANFEAAIRTVPVVAHARHETIVDKKWLDECVGPYELVRHYTLQERNEIFAAFLETAARAFDEIQELVTTPPTTYPIKAVALDANARYESANALFVGQYVAAIGFVCYDAARYRQLYLMVGWLRARATFQFLKSQRFLRAITSAHVRFIRRNYRAFTPGTSDPYPPAVQGTRMFAEELTGETPEPYVDPDAPEPQLWIDVTAGAKLLSWGNAFHSLCHPSAILEPEGNRTIHAIGDAVQAGDWDEVKSLATSMDADVAAISAACAENGSGFTLEQMRERLG